MIATEAPTNCWTQAQDAIMVALANSTRFREIVQAANSTEALTRIFGDQLTNPDNGYVYTLDELAELRAYAQVYTADEGGFGFTDTGQGWLRASGAMTIDIARLVTEYEQNTQEKPIGSLRWFENRVGDTMRQLHAYLDANSGPQIKSILAVEGPSTNDRTQWDSIGKWQVVELLVEWGY